MSHSINAFVCLHLNCGATEVFGFKAAVCTQLALLCTSAHTAELPPQEIQSVRSDLFICASQYKLKTFLM